VAAQADWLEKDLYALLGVAEDADGKTITRAYRQLARELHPDTHPDDPAAEERFKEITAAYDVIGDPDKRAEYDEFRRAVAGGARPGGWPGGGRGTGFDGGDNGTWTWFRTGDPQGPNGESWESFTFDPTDFDDLLGSMFGGGTRKRADSPRRGADLEATLDLGFEDAVRGLTADVTINGPDGLRTFKVRVPAGVADGQRIRLPGKGGPGANGGPSGDLYAVVRVGQHPVFKRNGRDLTVEAPVSWPEAVLGTEIDVPTLDGPTVRVRVPAGTPHGRTLRVRGRGVRTADGTGDLLVGIRVTVPDQLTDQQRSAVEAVAEAFKSA
jgi:molecular chaperone DnaJ